MEESETSSGSSASSEEDVIHLGVRRGLSLCDEQLEVLSKIAEGPGEFVLGLPGVKKKRMARQFRVMAIVLFL